MDYFNNVLTTFLGLERVSCVALYKGSESSRISSKFLICVPKMKKVLRVRNDEGEQLMTEL